MGKPLVPELHDIAKLYDVTDEVHQSLDLKRGSLHSGNRLELVPGKLGLPEPATNTWRGIVQHHLGGISPKDRDLFLLILADHAGANVARPRKPEEDGAKPLHRTVHKLWNPQDQHELNLPGSMEELRSLVQWLATDPDRVELFDRYGQLLDSRPEDLRPPLNTTSLASHVTTVGKIYRFLDQRVKPATTGQGWDFYGDRRSVVRDAENSWCVGLLKAEIGFPQQIVRTRDLALFDSMGHAIEKLTEDDRVLVATFNQVLAILGPDEEAEAFLSPLLESGFRVSWERARIPIGELESTPAEHRKERIRELEKEVSRIPSEHRADALAKRWQQIDAEYPRGVSIAPLKERFCPPICDVCQMEPATKSWPEQAQAFDPRENLGERCYALRQRASRLLKLDRWTDEPSARVAWVFVGLDLDRLVAFLRPLCQDYARQVGWSQDRSLRFGVRPPLIVEFQKDYRRLLTAFAASLERSVGTDHLEYVGGEAGEVAQALLCVRLKEVGQIPLFLNLYCEGVKQFFPVALQERLPGGREVVIPFRLGVSVSGVKFPFSEHWRVLRKVDSDVLINVLGRGQIRAPLASLPFLIEAGRSHNLSALHNLAEVAKISESLARIYVHDREGKYAGQYRHLLRQVQPLGMTYTSLVTYAKLLGE